MHQPGIIEEDIQLGLSGEEFFGRFCDGLQVGEIESEELEASSRRRKSGTNSVDGFCGFGLATGCDVDGRVLGVEDLRELFADAGVGSGNNVDLYKKLAMARRMATRHRASHFILQTVQVVLCKGRFRWPHLRQNTHYAKL